MYSGQFLGGGEHLPLSIFIAVWFCNLTSAINLYYLFFSIFIDLMYSVRLKIQTEVGLGGYSLRESI